MNTGTPEVMQTTQEYVDRAIVLLKESDNKAVIVLTMQSDGTDVMIGSNAESIAPMLAALLLQLEMYFPNDSDLIFADALMQKVGLKRELLLEKIPAQGHC